MEQRTRLRERESIWFVVVHSFVGNALLSADL